MDSLSINAQIGENVKLARKSAGLDVIQLAVMIDASTDQIERIEAGTHRASAEILWLMARAMGVSVSVFFTEFGESPKM